MEQTITTPTTKGIVLGLVLILISIGIYFSNIDLNGPVRWVPLAVFLLGIIWAIYSYGQQVNHNATFGHYFSHGFKTTAVVTALMILYLILFVTFFPDFKERAMEQARDSMRKNPNMSSEQIDQALTMTKKFFTVFLIGGTLVMYLIIGTLAALVGAAFTKKNPGQIPPEFNQP